MGNKLKLGITIGDFNGIGPELILRSLSNDLILNHCTPVVYGNKFVFKHYANLLELNHLDFKIVKSDSQVDPKRINLRICSDERIEIEPGIPSEQAGSFAFEALKMAVSDIKSGLIDNLVTAPIDKNSTNTAGMAFNGHTQFFAHEFESEVQMILLNDSLRVAMVTGHTPINNIVEQLSQENIQKALRALDNNLKSDFGIKKPRIAVLGLNPHSGDNGLIGSEEITTILPAIHACQKEGILAIGPYPADGLFGSQNINNFDAVLGMYHDQVLAPFKQVAFDDGVNYTAGLPFIRTSPDHGTAYDIAGKGIANISSMVNAIFLVNRVYRNRMEFYKKELEPLPFKEHRREKFSIGIPDLK